MLNFLEVCGFIYLASGITMAASVAVESTRKWYINALRRHEYYQLTPIQYHRVSARGW